MDTWFNVFVLHQNRIAHSQSTKDCMRESYLPRFLDFVVWGHEHECIIDPWVLPYSFRSRAEKMQTLCRTPLVRPPCILPTPLIAAACHAGCGSISHACA